MCQILIQCHHLCRRYNQYFIPLSPGVNYLYVPNNDFLAQAEVATMFALLIQRRLRWLGHVSYSTASYATGTRPEGEPTCRFIEVCKRDLKAGNINPAAWEAVAVVRGHRRLVRRVRRGPRRRRLWAASVPTDPYKEFICNNCNRACRSRIGLFPSHRRRCD